MYNYLQKRAFLFSVVCASSLVYSADAPAKNPTPNVKSETNESSDCLSQEGTNSVEHPLDSREVNRDISPNNENPSSGVEFLIKDYYIDKNFKGFQRAVVGSALVGLSVACAAKHAQLARMLFRAAPHGILNKTYAASAILPGCVIMTWPYCCGSIAGAAHLYQGSFEAHPTACNYLVIEAKKIIARQNINIDNANNAFVS